MNNFRLRKLVLLPYVFILCNVASGQIAKVKDETFYDIGRSVQNAVEKINIAQSLESNYVDYGRSGIYDDLLEINPKYILSLLLNYINSEPNNTCFKDLNYTAEDLKRKDIMKSWALQMLDAFGKPESGFLEGNLHWLGDYNECRNVFAPKQNLTDVGGFHGRYCSLGFSVSIFSGAIGICLPETCESKDFANILNITKLALNGTDMFKVGSLTCKTPPKTLSSGAIVTICIISLFLLLVILGSSLTIFKNFLKLKERRQSLCQSSGNDESASANCNSSKESNPNSLNNIVFTGGSRTKLDVYIDKFDPFLNCFCIFTNGSKLFSTDNTEGQLLCLHGIRFLSMSWVIVCHMYVTPLEQLRTQKNVITLIDNLPFQAILNGFYSVDSFFVLSGFLMSYLYFQEAAKNKGKTPWLYFYIHRYLRLTPVYMIVVAFYATILPFLGSGPYWPDYEVDPSCKKNWWWNLLYINNFQDQQCMGWAWYLANDMQFFVISPLFLITLWRWPKIGLSILSLFLSACWVSNFVITYHYNLYAGLFGITKQGADPNFISRFLEFMNKIYYKPYTRMAPYLIGIVLGYIMYKKKITNFKVNRTTLWIGWLTAITVGLYCVYGMYQQIPSLLGASFYNALARTFYAISLSWVILVCLSGQGGPVDKILSYKLFIPLSRLTYSAYLIHLIIVHIYFSSLKTTLDFTHQTMVLLFLGIMIVTYALSVMVTLTFESPLIRLEKLIRNKLKSSRQS